MQLTFANTRDYDSAATQHWAAGIGLLRKAAKSRNVTRNAAFLRLVSPFLGGLGGEPQGSSVRFPDSPTRPVPPSRLDSGVRLTNMNESEYTMNATIIDRETASNLNPLIDIFTEGTLSQCSRMIQAIGYLLSQIDTPPEGTEPHFDNLYLLFNPIVSALKYETANPHHCNSGKQGASV